MPPCSVRARGDNHADSDTDIMIDIAPAADATMSVYDVRRPR
jgi:predicted nucleotidyltransferase